MKIKPRTLFIGLSLFLGYFDIGFAAEHVIGQKNKEFSKSEITINRGDTIKFVNDDDTVHNVFSTSATNRFNGGAQKPADEYAQKFDTAGEVNVRCAIHPNMNLKVIVK